MTYLIASGVFVLLPLIILAIRRHVRNKTLLLYIYLFVCTLNIYYIETEISGYTLHLILEVSLGCTYLLLAWAWDYRWAGQKHKQKGQR